MKQIKLFKSLLFFIFCMPFFQLQAGTPTGAYDRFSTPVNTSWGTEDVDVYSISVAEGITAISATDAGGPSKYQSFSYTFPEPIDISNTPALRLKLKAWWNVKMRVDVQDVNGYSSSEYPDWATTSDDGRFDWYEISFMGATHWENGEEVDLTQIEKLIFYLNADEDDSYTGDIQIDDIFIGDVKVSFDEENFSDGSLDHGWTATSGYTLTELEDEENLQVDAVIGENNTSKTFSYTFQPLNLSNDASVSFDLLSDSDVTLQVDLIDKSGFASELSLDAIYSQFNGVKNYSLDFSTSFFGKASITSVEKVRFTVKTDNFDGTFYLDNLKIGTDPNAGKNQAPVIGIIPNQILNLGEDFSPIELLEYISDTDGDDFTIEVDGNVELSAVINNNTLTVTKPSADWVGSETLTITATDTEENTNSATVTFAVSPTGHYNNFETVVQGSWSADGEKYKASVENGETLLEIIDAGGEGNYDAVAYDFNSPVDISEMMYFSLKVRTSEVVELRFDLVDADGNATSSDPFLFEPIEDGIYEKAWFTYYSNPEDITTGNDVDMTKIKQLVVFANANVNSAFSGDVYIDEIVVGDYRPTYLIDDFGNSALDRSWTLADEYTKLAENAGEMTFTADIPEMEYASIFYEFPRMNLSANPYLNISVKSDKKVTIGIDIEDESGTYSTPILQSIEGDDFFHNLTCDFTELLGDVDINAITKVSILVNPVGDAVTANMAFDKIEIGVKGEETGNQPPHISSIPMVEMAADSPIATIDLSDYIKDDITAFADLTITTEAPDELSSEITDGILSIVLADKTFTGVSTILITASDEEEAETVYKLSVRTSDGSINPYGFAERFDGMTDSDILTDAEEFTLTVENEVLMIKTENVGGFSGYQGVSIEFPHNIDLTNNQDFSIDITSDDEFEIRMDLVDANGEVGNYSLDDVFDYIYDYYFDYNGATATLSGSFTEFPRNEFGDELDMSKIKGIILYFNAGVDPEITTSITVDNLLIGSQNVKTNSAPTILDLPTDVTIIPSQESITIDLNKYVEDETADEDLKWSVSDEAMFDISITDGIATITPDYTKWNADEEILFTVTDPYNKSSDITFTLSLNSENQPPIITSIPKASIHAGKTSVEIDLSEYISDDSTAFADLDLQAAAPEQFTVSITSGVMTIELSETEWTGVDSITISASDEKGLSTETRIIVRVLENAPALYSYTEHFDGMTDALYETDWDNISLTVADEELQITLDEVGGWDVYEAMSITLAETIDLSNDRSFQMTVSAQEDIDFRIDLVDANGNVGVFVDDEYQSDGNITSYYDYFENNGEPATLSGYFSSDLITLDGEEVDQTQIKQILIYFNPDNRSVVSGTVIIDDILLGNEALVTNQPPLLTKIPNQTITQGEEFESINIYDYVEDETADEDLEYYITDNVNITAGNSESGFLYTVIDAASTNGLVTFSLIDETWTGQETVTLIVIDEFQEQTSSVITFKVIEKTENQAPVITAITDQTIKQAQTFNMINLSNYVEDETDDANIVWTLSGNDNIKLVISDNILSVSVMDDSWSGSETITLTATDKEGLSASVEVTFTVEKITAENSAPSVSEIPAQTIKQGEVFETIKLNDYVSDETLDADIAWTFSGNENLTISITNQVATIEAKSADWFGKETITFTATDEEGEATSTTVIFTIEEIVIPNKAPVITTIPDQKIKQGDLFNIINLNEYVEDETADLDIKWEASDYPLYFNTNITDNILTFLVQDNLWFGSETITLTATDEEGLSASVEVTFTVEEVTAENSAPSVSEIPVQTIKQGEVFATIILNDYVSDETADADIVWTFSGNENLTVSITDQEATIEAKLADWFGSETITFKATDEEGLSASVEVTFTVEEVPAENSAPSVSEIPAQTIKQGEVFATIKLNDYVSDETADADIAWTFSGNENLTVSITDQEATIEAKLADWFGSETITFMATDEEGLSASVEVTFTVEEVPAENSAPSVSEIPAQTIKQGEVFATIKLNDYVSDETADADIAWTFSGNENLTVSIIDQEATIEAKLADWFGSETITFMATDEEGLSATTEAKFTINYVDTEKPVVEQIIPVTVESGADFPVIDLTQYVQKDSDASNLAFSAETTAELNLSVESGKLSIAPSSADWSGEAEIIVTVTDPSGNITEVSFSITREVAVENSAPEFSEITTIETEAGSFAQIDLSKYVTDENVSALTFTVQTSENVTATQTGTVITITPKTTNFAGTETIRLTAIDDEGKTATTEFDVKFGDGTVSVERNSIEFSVYPNPATHFITVKAENVSTCIISIFDITGNEIFRTESNTIKVSELESGYYLITLTNGNQMATQKLIIK